MLSDRETLLQEIAELDAVIANELAAGPAIEPVRQVQLVSALYRKAFALHGLERDGEAAQTAAEVVHRFAERPPAEAVPDIADTWLLLVGLMFHMRPEREVIVMYDVLIARYDEERDPRVRGTIGRARLSRAGLLGKQGRIDEAIAACDDVLAQIGDQPDQSLSSVRALALAHRAHWRQVWLQLQRVDQ